MSENNSPKSKISSEHLLGLAAVIASIAIPLAQFFVGYFEQKASQQQNQRLEEERRRFEITKLFMENYVGKPATVQMATVQIMKTLDPNFFISIEGGLKEATKSDSVRQTIQNATIEAANELAEKPNQNNKKVQKVLSAKELHDKGFEYLQKGDVENAQKTFEKLSKEHPSYHQTTILNSNDFSTINSDKDLKKIERQMNRDLKKQMKNL